MSAAPGEPAGHPGIPGRFLRKESSLKEYSCSRKGKHRWWRFQCSFVFCCSSEWKSQPVLQQTKAANSKKILISAASQSRTSSEIQRGKIILGCTFVLIKGITSFRATAAYEWEKSEFYTKSIFFLRIKKTLFIWIWKYSVILFFFSPYSLLELSIFI